METDENGNDSGSGETSICSGTKQINADAGKIISSNFPDDNYDPASVCQWLITVTPGKTVGSFIRLKTFRV